MRITTTLGILLFFCLCTSQAKAQLDITNFGKDKKMQPNVLSVNGPQPTLLDNLNPFKRDTPVLSFQRPISAVDRFQQSTQRVLDETKEKLAKPFRDFKSIDLWPNNENATDNQKFQIVPEWLKMSRKQDGRPPALADWLP